MRCITLIILLPCIAHVHAEESAEKSTGKLVDGTASKLAHRALNALPLGRADLNDATLQKPGTLMSSRPALLRPPSGFAVPRPSNIVPVIAPKPMAPLWASGNTLRGTAPIVAAEGDDGEPKKKNPKKGTYQKKKPKGSVRIRFQRWGRHKRPFYRIVAADRRSPRDGKFIEILGTYNPMSPKEGGTKEVRLKMGRIRYWLGVGAQPSDTVANLLAKATAVGSQ